MSYEESMGFTELNFRTRLTLIMNVVLMSMQVLMIYLHKLYPARIGPFLMPVIISLECLGIFPGRFKNIYHFAAM